MHAWTVSVCDQSIPVAFQCAALPGPSEKGNLSAPKTSSRPCLFWMGVSVANIR